MTPALTASITDLILDLTLGAAGPAAGNRFTIEGLTCSANSDGALEVRIQRLAAASLRLASGPLTLEIEQLALHQLAATVRIEGGRPRLLRLEAASVELAGGKIDGPLKGSASPPAHPRASQAPANAWGLAPLAAADGTIRAEIVDAHLLFDADVTVPVRQGKVDFKDATVEHVGPDSRMGVSRLGLYVDAPNGRSYLYQFSSTPVAGVEYERRGAMLGPWVTHRGSLQLQAFGEWLLRQLWGGQASGLTQQARLLFDRTAVSGEVQLSDGRFAAPGVQADVVGRADGRNVVRLHSEAVGRGLTVDMASLLARDGVLSWSGARVECDEITGALMLRVSVEDRQLRFAFELATLKLSGLQLHPPADAARARRLKSRISPASYKSRTKAAPPFGSG